MHSSKNMEKGGNKNRCELNIEVIREQFKQEALRSGRKRAREYVIANYTFERAKHGPNNISSQLFLFHSFDLDFSNILLGNPLRAPL